MLHVELVFDHTHPIGRLSHSGLADVLVESALSAIFDLEDSIACVDVGGKLIAYLSCRGLMKRYLSETFEKCGDPATRSLNPDRFFAGPNGVDVSVRGGALLLVRNVGHLMTNPAILNLDGNAVFEGLMDVMITIVIALHDLKKSHGLGNSVNGSV